MEYKNIICTIEDAVTTVILNRPDKLNALDANTLKDLVHSIEAALRDDEVKVLVISGTGRGFCSGADLSSPDSGTNTKLPGIGRQTRQEPFILFGEVMKRLKNFHKPIITAVNGIASGAGLSLAMLGDVRIASDQARFSAIFVRRGLVADSGATYLLPRIVGSSKALELMWTGEIIDATEAERIGLAGKVVPHDELMSATMELAATIASGPSLAIELMKRMVYSGLESNNFDMSLAYEGWAQEMCYTTEDSVEGVKSFMEKREAKFKGK